MDESIISDAAASQMHTELPESLREPTHPKNLLFLTLFGVANMAIGVGSITLSSVLLPMQVATIAPGNQTGVFSLILGLGALAAVLTNPLAGMLSDRTTSRLGRRRPWFIVGGVLVVLDLLVMGHAPSLLVVGVGYVCEQIAMNLVQVACSAIIPDQVPVRQRATVSAFTSGLGVLLGGVVGQLLVAQYFTGIAAAYTSLAVTIAIMVTLFLFVLRDIPLSKEHVRPLRGNQIFDLLKPLTHRDFALTWVARCLIFLGYTTVISYMFFFLTDAVHYTKVFPGQTAAQGVQMFFVLNVAAIIVASLVGGIISDRLQRRKLFVIIASVTIAAGLLLYAFFPTWSLVLVGTTVLGFGTGVYLSVDLALASQVLPAAADRGKDMGIINTAIFLPQVLAPVFAGITLNVLHSYLALFLFLAIGALIAAVLVVPIKGVR